MKLECVQDKLRKAVVKSARIASKHVSLPVLQTILFTAEGSDLVIQAFNLELGVKTTLKAKVEESGSVAVPADVFSRYLNLVKSEVVQIEVSGGILKLTSGNDVTEFKTVNHEDFPELPDIDETSDSVVSKTVLPVELFMDGLSSVKYATAVSAMKPELSSVYLYENNDNHNLICVATDAFRLAEKKIAVDASGFPKTLLPFKSVNEIDQLLAGETGDVEFLFDEHLMMLKSGAMSIVTKTTAGSYPDYTKLIPVSGTTTARFLKKDFEEVIKRAAVFANVYNRIKLSIDDEAGLCRVKIVNDELGSVDVAIKAQIEGSSIELHYNYRHIIEAFSSISSDSIEFVFNKVEGGAKPLLIRGVDDTTFQYVVMPLTK